MNLKVTLAIALSAVSLQLCSLAHAEEHREERGAPRGEPHGGARPNPPPRPAPPQFRAHPPGAHPHGPTVRPHATRVMSPRVIKYGNRPWHHWSHAEFSRPVYYWNWSAVHSVSCIAEDSYGDQYPVTEETFSGFGLTNMTAVEDDALDRCYDESGQDQSCYLATCSHY
jgi:hypothetical protein